MSHNPGFHKVTKATRDCLPQKTLPRRCTFRLKEATFHCLAAGTPWIWLKQVPRCTSTVTSLHITCFSFFRIFGASEEIVTEGTRTTNSTQAAAWSMRMRFCLARSKRWCRTASASSQRKLAFIQHDDHSFLEGKVACWAPFGRKKEKWKKKGWKNIVMEDNVFHPFFFQFSFFRPNASEPTDFFVRGFVNKSPPCNGLRRHLCDLPVTQHDPTVLLYFDLMLLSARELHRFPFDYEVPKCRVRMFPRALQRFHLICLLFHHEMFLFLALWFSCFWLRSLWNSLWFSCFWLRSLWDSLCFSCFGLRSLWKSLWFSKQSWSS